MLAGIDAMEDSPIPVLYQSGYLTLKDFDSRFGLYTLGFPNREVEEGFQPLSFAAYLVSGPNRRETIRATLRRRPAHII